MYHISTLRAIIRSLNKHQQKTEATKRKLLKAARQIFARDGFEATRIDDIARSAGYTRGAFYAHFQTKEDLFFALLEQQADRRLEKVRLALESQTDDQGRIRAMRESYIANLNDKQWPILLMEFKLYALRHPKLRAKLADAHRRIATRMKLEKLASVLPSIFQMNLDRKEQIRIGLEATMCGLVLQQAYDPKSISRTEAEALLGLCFHSLVQACGPTEDSSVVRHGSSV